MKIYIRLALSFFLICFLFVLKTMAIDTGFSTEILTEEEKDEFVSHNKIFYTEEETKKTIICFDVNENGLIALGHDEISNKGISVYSEDGEFLYGYTFDCDGIFGVEWNKENINIYFVRGSYIAEIDLKGEILDVMKVENNSDNNSYVNHNIFATKKSIDNKTYTIKNKTVILDIFTGSYSQLTVTNSNGTEEILYNISTRQLIKTVVWIGCIVISLTIVCCVVIYNVKDKKKEDSGRFETTEKVV